MLRVAVFVALATVICGESFNVDQEWERFKFLYDKNYQKEEEIIRHKIFLDNVGYINQHNSENHSFTLGINEYADMTSDEFVEVMNGYRMQGRVEERFGDFDAFGRPEETEGLPRTVDWRTKGYVTGVKNQGTCGSCWAFSATGSLEGQHFKKTGKLVSLSEQNLVDCSGPEGNEGCQGGLMDNAFTYIEDNKGIDTEISYPYKAVDGTCKFKRMNVGATDTGFVDITEGSETALQQAVATVGPISVAIDAHLKSFHLYKNGVYADPACSSTKLDHGVLAVGYGTFEGKDYWLVKNSWGTSWGNKGYIMMARNVGNMCGIATAASYPTV